MLTVFSHQVLRLLRDKTLLVWTLGFPIVLSFIFMVQFSNLEEAYEASPMSFGIIQDEAYRAAPRRETRGHERLPRRRERRSRAARDPEG